MWLWFYWLFAVVTAAIMVWPGPVLLICAADFNVGFNMVWEAAGSSVRHQVTPATLTYGFILTGERALTRPRRVVSIRGHLQPYLQH